MKVLNKEFIDWLIIIRNNNCTSIGIYYLSESQLLVKFDKIVYLN